MKYVRKIFPKTDIFNPYHGVSENFAYVHNGWPLDVLDPSLLSKIVITTSLRNPVCLSVLKWLNKYACFFSKLFAAFRLFSF